MPMLVTLDHTWSSKIQKEQSILKGFVVDLEPLLSSTVVQNFQPIFHIMYTAQMASRTSSSSQDLDKIRSKHILTSENPETFHNLWNEPGGETWSLYNFHKDVIACRQHSEDSFCL